MTYNDELRIYINEGLKRMCDFQISLSHTWFFRPAL